MLIKMYLNNNKHYCRGSYIIANLFLTCRRGKDIQSKRKDALQGIIYLLKYATDQSSF